MSYSIVSGDDSGTEKFTMNNNVVETHTTALDYETTSRYELKIDVVDNPSSTPQNTVTATVIVLVNKQTFLTVT